MLSSTGGTIAQKKVKGEKIKGKDILVSSVTGMVSGGVGSVIGGGTNSIIANKITD